MKFKVGALDFDEECRMLERFRRKAPASSVQIRLDANGGFEPKETAEQLKELSRFTIHSIEQPIGVNQWDDMARLCREAAIDIALDEELIGRDVHSEGESMLDELKPAYIILKPNLIGGFGYSDAWIKLAESKSIGWWATSALESNLGLSAIAQWVAKYPIKMPQGLGTGSLYENNVEVPIAVEAPYVKYQLP
jgi:L-alanine-DL-glutamate epimerase-like enolase superfamily enzyme